MSQPSPPDFGGRGLSAERMKHTFEGVDVIVSHELKLIFVKTRKTAGTSIEIALSRHAGVDDIITPIAPEDEQLRRNEGGRGPQNYRVSRRYASSYAKCSLLSGHPRSAARLLLRPFDLFNHAPASLIRRVVGDEAWNQYVCFTVERNPWDRAVSLYYYAIRHSTNKPTFSAFLRAAGLRQLSNFHLYAIDGSIAVDQVVRYEQLATELADFWRTAGISGTPDLPHAKSTLRPSESLDYRRMFTEADAELIAEICRPEIEAHGYTFD